MVTRENVTWMQLQQVAAMDLTNEDIGDFATPQELVRYAVGGNRAAKQRCVDIFNARSAAVKP
jgi:hypothetical protein